MNTWKMIALIGALAFVVSCSDCDNNGVPDKFQCNEGIDDGLDIRDCDCPDKPGSPADCPSGNPIGDACVNGDCDGDGDPRLSSGGTDCDDADPNAHPGAPEICNGLNDDCDDEVDEGCGGTGGNGGDGGTGGVGGIGGMGGTGGVGGSPCVPRPFYPDVDRDGYGSNLPVNACTAPAGYVDIGGDCDDSNVRVHLGAPEICNGADEDCDNVIDNNALNAWYVDADLDGHGNPTQLVATVCTGESFLSSVGDDCDDQNIFTYPGASEFCNGRDDDCDGVLDNDYALDAITRYADTDGDGEGDPANRLNACNRPIGYVDSPDDCDDSDAALNHMDVDRDGKSSCDNDCDDTDALLNLADADADGVSSCAGDCDDDEPLARPDLVEFCDGIDNNCDGLTDDSSAVDPTTFYQDTDLDTYGDPNVTADACDQPPGFVDNADDCNDLVASVHPFALEFCNSRDDDCDGNVDDNAINASTWYRDFDLDTFGDPNVTNRACVALPNFVANSRDCDDTRSDIHPNATEVCGDAKDNDCDGFTDDGTASNALTFFADVDGDTFGDGTSTIRACTQPPGYVNTATDCDDASRWVNPNAVESCNGLDDDCDSLTDEAGATGETTWYNDNDGDTYGNPLVTIVACNQPANHVANNRDCDDVQPLVNPAATELCDGLDNDCDGTIDEPDADDAGTWYLDADADTFGNALVTQTSCNQPARFVANATDCDDLDLARYPGAAERCNNLDDNCNGTVPANEADADADGVRICNGDCDDTRADVLPGATELCDGRDNDCNGAVPANEADGDGDGSRLCAGDCDDAVATRRPGAPELCNGVDDDCNGAVPAGEADGDADGFRLCAGDCDDLSAAVFPGAPELCDGQVDNNCDGVAPLNEADADGDGVRVCAGDCDDTRANVNPNAVETCDTIDNDCDGLTDEGVTTTFFEDRDVDGFGDSVTTIQACAVPSGYVADNRDCDDRNNLVNPNVVESCNGLDDDCDSLTDEAGATGETTWYDDNDGDTYGNPLVTIVACNQPANHVANNRDCDDTRRLINPAAIELCDGLDNDCDGTIDGSAADDAGTWYVDGDGDGFGRALVTVTSCSQPVGFVGNATDCDDASAARYPGNPEVCDGIDNDCNTIVDEGVTATFFRDVDGDSYGTPTTTTQACAAPAGYVANATDCDDSNAVRYPGNPEACDTFDNDCDGLTDEGVTTTFFEDRDVDGFGNANVTVQACAVPANYVANNRDCNDVNNLVNPNAVEACNGIDDDCDSLTDEAGATGAATWYNDNDLDTYGNPLVTQTSCNRPAGYVVNSADCNDGNASVFPGAPELCNGTDDDCDGATDEGVTATFFRDVDGDSYGTPTTTTQACAAPAGYVANATDCDDTSAARYPGNPEVCGDGIDQDCNNIDQICPCADADGDGFASSACGGTDCNDGQAFIKPGAIELCDGLDNNCDTLVDESTAADASDWYRDADVDTFGNPLVTQRACNQPVGFVANSTDCNDANATVRPGAVEACNGIDDDCDGSTDEGLSTDADGDGHKTLGSCAAPADDCDDANANMFPGNPEICGDGIDQDCSGADLACGSPDADGDGFTIAGGDCEDANPAINPGAVEICNGLDDDCNGTVDDPSQCDEAYVDDMNGDGVPESLCLRDALFTAGLTWQTADAYVVGYGAFTFDYTFTSSDLVVSTGGVFCVDFTTRVTGNSEITLISSLAQDGTTNVTADVNGDGIRDASVAQYVWLQNLALCTSGSSVADNFCMAMPADCDGDLANDLNLDVDGDGTLDATDCDGDGVSDNYLLAVTKNADGSLSPNGNFAP